MHERVGMRNFERSAVQNTHAANSCLKSILHSITVPRMPLNKLLPVVSVVALSCGVSVSNAAMVVFTNSKEDDNKLRIEERLKHEQGLRGAQLYLKSVKKTMHIRSS